jgi:steroid delta-isomerase-like uncharacterized protein
MTNKELARRIFGEIYTNGNLDLVEETHGEHCKLRDPTFDTILEGPEAARAYVASLRTAFPDFRITVDRQIAENDLVASQVVCEGTHKGEYLGMPASNRKGTVRATIVQRFRNGKVEEADVMWDVLGLFYQLGLKPAEAIHDEVAAALRAQPIKMKT